MHMYRMHAVSTDTPAAITASRAKIRHLPPTMSQESLGRLVTQLAVKVQANGTVNRDELDQALQQTSLSVSDRIRIKAALTGR